MSTNQMDFLAASASFSLVTTHVAATNFVVASVHTTPADRLEKLGLESTTLMAGINCARNADLLLLVEDIITIQTRLLDPEVVLVVKSVTCGARRITTRNQRMEAQRMDINGRSGIDISVHDRAIWWRYCLLVF